MLAVLWLRSVDAPHGALRVFAGRHQFVADYLSEEVFDSLSPDTRDFLLHVSVLRTFPAELCDVALEPSDSAAVLDGLQSSSLLVTPLERGGWSRCTPSWRSSPGFGSPPLIRRS